LLGHKSLLTANNKLYYLIINLNGQWFIDAIKREKFDDQNYAKRLGLNYPTSRIRKNLSQSIYQSGSQIDI